MQEDLDSRSIMDAMPMLIWKARPDGGAEALNDSWVKYTGLSEQHARGWAWLDAVHPDYREPFLVAWGKIRATQTMGEFEVPLRGHGGDYRWFLARMIPAGGAGGGIPAWYVSHTDIEERKQVEILLQGKNQILEMLAKGEPLSLILERICLLIQRVFPRASACILLFDPIKDILRKGAAPSFPPLILRVLEAGVSLTRSSSPCGRAAFERTLQIITDLNHYEGSPVFRELALSHGWLASWSAPVISPSTQLLGTISIYLCERISPDRRQIEVIEQMAHLTAIAIEQSQAREDLRRSEAHLATAQRLISTGSFSWNAVTQKMTWSDETYRICEVDRSVTPTGEMTRDLIHPEDLPLFLEMIMGGRRDYNFECRLKLPSGIKHIQVVGVAERDASGQLQEWVGTFMDITERKKTALALSASERLARGQVEALRETLTLMSLESAPERILDHVLQMICRQLKAHSLSVWEMDHTGNFLNQVANCESDRMHLTAAEEITAAPRMEVPKGKHPIWTEFFRDGQRVVLGDLSCNPIRVRFADADDTAWFSWLSGVKAHPELPVVQAELAAAGNASTLFVPMLVAGKVGALISIKSCEKRTFDRGELELAHALAHQAALAMELGRLSQESKQAAILAERNRLARDIHDTLAQGLTGIIIQLRAARDATARGFAPEADAHLVRAGELAGESLREARRSVRALRPRVLEERDLTAVLEEMFARMTADTQMHAKLTVHGRPFRLDSYQEEHVLRVSQEVLTNALKHAHASLFSVQLSYQLEAFKMEYRDNGCGFDQLSKFDGFGLIGIRERIENLGGNMALESVPGRGTFISFVLPISQVSRRFDS